MTADKLYKRRNISTKMCAARETLPLLARRHKQKIFSYTSLLEAGVNSWEKFNNRFFLNENVVNFNFLRKHYKF